MLDTTYYRTDIMDLAMAEDWIDEVTMKIKQELGDILCDDNDTMHKYDFIRWLEGVVQQKQEEIWVLQQEMEFDMDEDDDNVRVDYQGVYLWETLDK